MFPDKMRMKNKKIEDADFHLLSVDCQSHHFTM